MSYLRDIMRRMNARQGLALEQERDHPAANLASHLDDYGQKLQACSSAMLQYEWAWLEQHLATLELCGSRPEMLATAGGQARVKAMVEESLLFQDLIKRQLVARGLAPSLHRATVVATEHAWELTHGEIRRQWGIEADPSAESHRTGGDQTNP